MAGQPRPYIERQLAAFSSSARANEIMRDNSKNLTVAEITEVAAFVAAESGGEVSSDRRPASAPSD